MLFWLKSNGGRAQAFCLCLLLIGGTASAQVVINEILFNPPGVDAPNQYIELRGPPNQLLANGTYFVAVEGDTNGNPGTVQNVFDLSGKQIGGNGFLAILEKTNSYSVNSNATLLINTGKGPGFGSGSSSSINHRGEGNQGGQTELEHGSATYFLIQSATAPPIGADIDPNDDGVPDGPVYSTWTILDSVGILDDGGLGDVAYGAINFRRNAAATAFGNIVSVGFNPDYVGRTGNTTGSSASDWVASSSLGGSAPNWTLGSSANTVPSSLAGATLNHIGGPNFGAPSYAGVVAVQSGGSTDVLEGSGTDSYLLGLNTTPAGPVTIQIDAPGQVQISTDNGASFANSRSLTFSSTTQKSVLVRALADNTIDTSPHVVTIQHHITSTSDPANYPTTSLMPLVRVNVTEKDIALLSELKVNPPGQDDPYEFVEIKGPPNALLTNVYFVVVEGDAGNNPGTAAAVINLTSSRIGSSGLLVILANGSPYFIPNGTTAFYDSHLNIPGGALGNGSVSFLLISTPTPIAEGTDLDSGDNGTLEALPAGSFIMDAIGWFDGSNPSDLVYGGAVLSLTNGTPEAATRFGWDNTPRSADAWFYGELLGPNGDTLDYDEKHVSVNFPFGTPLTPGIFRNSPPSVRGLVAVCGAIGDPNNPTLTFRLVDANNPSIDLSLSLSSSNDLVVPESQLTLTALGNGYYNLALNPIGVGYSLISVIVTDDDLTATNSFLYAASEMGRPGGAFHIGASDGSTALAIDSNFMIVGDDENQVLRVYDRHASGYPLRTFDFNPFLALTDYYNNGLPKEVDIEASTRVGNRLYFMGSHSHGSMGEVTTNRSRIFTVDLTGTGTNISLNYVGRYEHLKEDLVNWDVNNGHGKGANYYGFAAGTQPGVDAKATNGFNIEGLTMIAASTNAAYIGFRAPISPAVGQTYSLLVPVMNFAAIATNNGPPGSAVFGVPVEIDLYGRGIRSIEALTNGNYMIVGGTPLDFATGYPLDFRLYTWDGDPNHNPQQRAANLSGMNPEGIVELPPWPWSSNSVVQLVSDNGTKVYYGDGVEAKHLQEPNFKKCRSDYVVLGDVVKPAPIIVSTVLSQSTVTITWRALRGETYHVQSSSNCKSGSWSDLSPDVFATAPYMSKTDTRHGQAFYRVLVLP